MGDPPQDFETLTYSSDGGKPADECSSEIKFEIILMIK
jgi:hypothetical protein